MLQVFQDLKTIEPMDTTVREVNSFEDHDPTPVLLILLSFPTKVLATVYTEFFFFPSL